MASGSAGIYAPLGKRLQSYAAGYPEPQDLFLAETVEVDDETGAFILEKGRPVFRETSLLIGWDEIEFIEFTHIEEETIGAS